MTVTIKHNKTNAIPDWTQTQLDAQIALGNFAPGTTLGDIVIPSDWNADHTITGLDDALNEKVNKSGDTMTGTLNMFGEFKLDRNIFDNEGGLYAGGDNPLAIYYGADDVFVFGSGGGQGLAGGIRVSGGDSSVSFVHGNILFSANGAVVGTQLTTDDGTTGVMFGFGADGSPGGTAVGNNANGTGFGTAIGNSADGHSYGVAIGVNANGVEGIAIGDSANGSSFGVAIGNGSNGSFSGLSIGAGSDGDSSGVAVGNSSNGSNSGVALGSSCNGSSGGVAIGNSSTALYGGIAIGLLATGDNGGTSIGLFSHGENTGVGIGQSAHGETNGVAIGSSAYGPDQGVALGAVSTGNNYGVGIGYSANGNGIGNVALGGDDSGILPATIPFGWTDTVELGRGTAVNQGGLNFRGMGIVDSLGGFTPQLMADGTAANNTIYFSTTETKLAYKDSNGTVNALSGSPVAPISTTGLTANVGATTLYTVPSTGAGMYRVSAYVVTTTAASVSSTMPNVQVVYTDKDSNTSVTLDVTPVLGAAGLGQSGLLTANTVGTVFSGVVAIYAKASTTIQYKTVNYASTAAGMTYALHVSIEIV